MKKLLKKSLLATTLFLLPVVIFAQTGNAPINIPNPTNAGSTLMQVLTAILTNVVMPIAAIAVVMYIIYAGLTFITAQGKPAEIEKAKQRLLWALIGAGILLSAAGIAKVVENTVRALLLP